MSFLVALYRRVGLKPSIVFGGGFKSILIYFIELTENLF